MISDRIAAFIDDRQIASLVESLKAKELLESQIREKVHGVLENTMDTVKDSFRSVNKVAKG